MRRGNGAAEVAHAAAVIDDVVTWQDVQPLTDLTPDTVAAALQDLAAADLLVGNGMLRFRLIREALGVTKNRRHPRAQPAREDR